MRVIRVRNVQDALPEALHLLDAEGVQRDSRNGPVKVVECGVVTVYERPVERVLFWPQRDANPALHLYEALWMLAGRNDVAPLVRYARQFLEYTDDGVTFHGAYGHRWRKWFPMDQLDMIVKALRENADDRRCVLQMWDANYDLGRAGRDVPCNLVASFQRDCEGWLNLTVFNRSNDIIWGCYGANAVHFSMLLEYMARRIGCPVGTYTQVSTNWHAYVDVYRKLDDLPRMTTKLYGYQTNPYTQGVVHPTTLPEGVDLDASIAGILASADTGCPYHPTAAWDRVFHAVLQAHRAYKARPAPERYTKALSLLPDSDADWIQAMRQWIERREDRWTHRQSQSS